MKHSSILTAYVSGYKHLLIITIMSLFSVVATGSLNAQTYMYFGDCRGRANAPIENVSLNTIYIKESGRAHWGNTGLFINNTPLSPMIRGFVGANIDQFLKNLANEGFYTVDMVGYTMGGWFIQGNKNALQENAARERQAQIQRTQQIRSTGSTTTASSQRQQNTKASKRCEEHLYSNMSTGFYNLKANINVTGEYINVEWGTTTRRADDVSDVYVVIIDRSGDERKLAPGQNWVDPGRYVLELRFYGISSTSVMVKFDCN